MKALFLALALALSSPPAQAGRAKKEQKRHDEAVQAAEALQLESLQKLDMGDLAGAMAAIDQAIAAHPEPPVELFLLRCTMRARAGLMEPAAADLRAAMAVDLPQVSAGQDHAPVTDVGTSLALAIVMEGSDPTEPIAEDKVVAALAVLDELDAWLATEGAEPVVRSASLRTRVAMLQVTRYGDPRLADAVDAALALEPQATDLRVLKAGLLADAGQLDAAHALAVEVLAADPTNLQANYLAASVLMVQASQLTEQGADTDDLDQATALAGEASALMLQARPHLEAAYAVQPDLELARQLLQIALDQGDSEAVERWKAERNRLQGG